LKYSLNVIKSEEHLYIDQRETGFERYYVTESSNIPLCNTSTTSNLHWGSLTSIFSCECDAALQRRLNVYWHCWIETSTSNCEQVHRNINYTVRRRYQLTSRRSHACTAYSLLAVEIGIGASLLLTVILLINYFFKIRSYLSIITGIKCCNLYQSLNRSYKRTVLKPHSIGCHSHRYTYLLI